MTTEEICQLFAELQAEELERWIDHDWVRPRGSRGEYVFAAIDVARVRLIVELRRDLEVDEATLPVVLSLLDQLNDSRRRLSLLHAAMQEALSQTHRDAVHASIRRRLRDS